MKYYAKKKKNQTNRFFFPRKCCSQTLRSKHSVSNTFTENFSLHDLTRSAKDLKMARSGSVYHINNFPAILCSSCFFEAPALAFCAHFVRVPGWTGSCFTCVAKWDLTQVSTEASLFSPLNNVSKNRDWWMEFFLNIRPEGLLTKHLWNELFMCRLNVLIKFPKFSLVN